ncbi:hypothetical protein OIU78_001252 [Salix suchowensis]|nr:hypothetical protein OIU78_001252 [Salix suchowensis]
MAVHISERFERKGDLGLESSGLPMTQMKKRNRYSSSSCVWKHLNPDANWNGEVIKGEFLPLPSQVRQIDFIVSDCKSCPGTSYDDTFRVRQDSFSGTTATAMAVEL